MTKRLLSLLLVLCMVFTLLPMNVLAEEKTAAAGNKCGDDLTWSFDNGVLTISGSGDMWDYDESIGTAGTTAPWSIHSSDIKSVVIESGVTGIGSGAFAFCGELTEVTIPDSVVSIGYGAFAYCGMLSAVELPTCLTRIAKNAFYECSSLTRVDIGSIEAWCDIAFANEYANPLYYAHKLYIDKELLTELVIPEAVTEIGQASFVFCNDLESVTIPEGVESIGEGAFGGCESLTNIVIPASVKSISSSAFKYCTSLNSVKFEGNAPTEFGSDVFLYCADDFTVYAPADNTTWAESSAYNVETQTWNGYTIEFYGTASENKCGDELTWSLEDGVLTISGTGNMYDYDWDNFAPWYSFKDGIRSVILPEGLLNIGDFAFYQCNALRSATVPVSVERIGRSAFRECVNLNSLTLCEGVIAISNNAFESCRSLTGVAIPASVEMIGESAFNYCRNLASITVADGNKVYHSKGNCLIETANKILLQGCRTSVIPSDGSVTVIENNAFAYCDMLTSIVIPEGITMIGVDAFAGCLELISVRIPASVTSIRENAFVNCESLSSIEVADGNKVYHSNGNCLIETASKTLVLGCKASTIPSDGSVTVIGQGAFYGCVDLMRITVPGCVKHIGETAFYYCRDLVEVTISAGVESIGDWAFSSCDHLINISIPAGVTSIGDYAFAYVYSLVNVFYAGSEDDWRDISIGNNNYILNNAQIHYDVSDPATHCSVSIRTAPTCTEQGRGVYTCDCGYSYTAYIAPLGHSYVDGICSRCGYRPISYIEAVYENNEYIEGTHGYFVHARVYDESIGEYVEKDWYSYDIDPNCVFLTIHHLDGTAKTVRASELDGIGIGNDQSAFTPWGIGEHRATVYYNNKSADITVSIVESPVDHIEASISDSVYEESTHGWMESSWVYDPETGNGNSVDWFKYNLKATDVVLTVYYKNGQIRTISGSDWENEEYRPELIDDQDYDNQWDIGSHDVTVYYMGKTATASVEIVESRIDHIEAELRNNHYVVGTNGRMTTTRVEDKDEGFTDIKWFRYYTPSVSNLSLTVYYKDGTSKTISYEEWENKEELPEIEDNQSVYNQWGIGRHEVTVSYMGKTATAYVFIIDSPISYIEAEMLTGEYIENTHGSTEKEWIIYGKEDVEVEWFRYNISASDLRLIIHYNDGTSETISGDAWSQAEELPDIITDQNYENRWGPGTHEATVSYMGRTTTVYITIVESPIDHIEAELLHPEIVEYTGGYLVNGWYLYTFPAEEFTLTLYYTNGDTKTVYAGSWWQEDIDLTIDTDQSAFAPWGPGKHDITVSCMGKSTTVTVTITESSVDHIEAQLLEPEILEGTYGQMMTSYVFDEVLGKQVEKQWFLYDISPQILNMTVYYNDGGTKTFNAYNWWNEDVTPRISTDQDYYRQWGPGQHEVTVSFMGKTDTVTINIVENPIDHIEAQLLKTQFTEGVDLSSSIGVRFNEYGEREEFKWKSYKLTPADVVLTIFYKDGSSRTASGDDLWDEEHLFDIITDQTPDYSWSVGQHDVTILYMGKTVTLTVEVLPGVAGDVTGDGKVDATDLVRLKKYVAGADVEIGGPADLNGDGKINAIDLIRLCKCIAEKPTNE